MPAAVAIPAIATVGAGLFSAGANIFGASKQASAAEQAAQLQSNAAQQAAQLQAQTAQQQLAFTRQQAGTQVRQDATTQLANYGLANAHTQRLNSLGAILGLPGQAMPAAPQLLQDEASGKYNPYASGSLGATISGQ